MTQSEQINGVIFDIKASLGLVYLNCPCDLNDIWMEINSSHLGFLVKFRTGPPPVVKSCAQPFSLICMSPFAYCDDHTVADVPDGLSTHG